ncbi:MAG: hypothetical protein NTZ98_22800 [Acidobacteria bacterium]|nr:hypothetical protein [Acidobacteriota bacterium]
MELCSQLRWIGVGLTVLALPLAAQNRYVIAATLDPDQRMALYSPHGEHVLVVHEKQ